MNTKGPVAISALLSIQAALAQLRPAHSIAFPHLGAQAGSARSWLSCPRATRPLYTIFFPHTRCSIRTGSSSSVNPATGLAFPSAGRAPRRLPSSHSNRLDSTFKRSEALPVAVCWRGSIKTRDPPSGHPCSSLLQPAILSCATHRLPVGQGIGQRPLPKRPHIVGDFDLRTVLRARQPFVPLRPEPVSGRGTHHGRPAGRAHPHAGQQHRADAGNPGQRR